ncbi:MAG: enoyl-CoA hydratase/isomerase family protein [Syntrophales bacterium]|nr:enoyl-CoA hydratase/isomerase family protein [Syntrophales bacterium]
MFTKNVIAEISEGLGIIKLNRPAKKNAINIEMRREITEVLRKWKEDSNVGAVIITGNGDVFSAGFDLGEFKETQLITEIFKTSSTYHREVWYFPKPTMAAVNGPALAGGFDLAKLCDLRICSDRATFGHPEIRFTPTLYTPLKWLIGAGLARDLCLSGRIIDAQEAFRIGLVSEITLPGRLLGRAKEIMKKIIDQTPQHVLNIQKRFFQTHDVLGFEESFAIEHDAAFQEFLLRTIADRTATKN